MSSRATCLCPADDQQPLLGPTADDAGTTGQCSWMGTCVQNLKDFWNNFRFRLLRDCAFFYVDFALDVNSILIYISTGCMNYALLNMFAIMGSNAYSFVEMRSSRPREEDEEAEDQGGLVCSSLSCCEVGISWVCFSLVGTCWYRQARNALNIVACP